MAMIYQETASLYNTLVDEYESQHPVYNELESDELEQIKNRSFELFKKKGFPTVKDEDWRFTSLIPFLKSEYSLSSAPANESLIQNMISEATIPGLDTYLLVLVNGQIHFGLSSLPDEELACIDSIRDICNNDKFTAHLNKNANNQDALTALNTAFFTNGLCIEIKKDTVLDKPIHILHLYTSEDNTFFQPRNFIVVNEGSKADLIETYLVKKKSGDILVNNVSELIIKENARLTHYQIQNSEPNERWLHHYKVSQERYSRYDNFTFSLPGSDLIRNDLEAKLSGTATETHLYGLYLVAGNQVTDNHTTIHHIHPSCQSNEIYKGVLMDNARGVFNGKVFVEREAQKTNAFQQNNNLLLSDKAQIHAKPQLEIFADDVKCSHGCTVGQFNPESMFYLRSRGIGENEAKKLLVEAFLFDVTDKISNDAIRAYVQQLIYDKLDSTSTVFNQ